MYLEPPEGVTGVRASVEKAAGLSACTQEVLSRQALGLGNVPDLMQPREMQIRDCIMSAAFLVQTNAHCIKDNTV